MNDKQFVQAVAKHKCIYGKGNLEFNKQARKLAWEQLSRQFNIPVMKLQQRWRILRDRYVREYRKKQCSAFKGSRHRREWDLFRYFEFLIPFVRCKVDLNVKKCGQSEEEIAEIPAVSVSSVTNEMFADEYTIVKELKDSEVSQDIQCIFEDAKHGGFYQMVVEKLNQLQYEDQEDAKMFFLNYLHNITKV